MDLKKFIHGHWFGIVLSTLTVFMAILFYMSYQYTGCKARWGSSFKVVEYSLSGGCLIEYPNGSGKLIPEEAIRILEEPVDQKRDMEGS